ncbi:hypothetical protein PG991_015242 [Apiospora marii]|uniref:Uncharacterized protein n=1 Tax=Apiospora marii TaxID=335849 RepID=A0ABR1R167_9PEZI
MAATTPAATALDKPSHTAISSSATTTTSSKRAAAAAGSQRRRRRRRRRKRSPPQSPKSINTIPEHDDHDIGNNNNNNNNNNNSNQDDNTDDDGFWSPPTSPVEERQEPQYRRVATDIRISLLGPDPALLAADSDEFKRQAKEIKKDLQRLSRYTRRQHSNPATMAEYSRLRRVSSPPPPPSASASQEREFRRRFSIQEGRDFLADFLRVHFWAHRDQVAIRADAASARTLEEIKMIGNEGDAASGVRQCRRLFNAPVLSDRVGSLLYAELRQGGDLDHCHEWRRFATDSDDSEGDGGRDGYERIYEEDEGEEGDGGDYKNKKKKGFKNRKQLSPDELRRRRVDEFERSKAEFLEMRQMAATVAQNSGTGTGLCQCALLGGPRAGQATSLFGCMVCSPPPPGGRASVPDNLSMAAGGSQSQRDGAAAAEEDELDPFSQDLLAGRNSVDYILSGVKRRTFRGAEKIAASLAAGYQ